MGLAIALIVAGGFLDSLYTHLAFRVSNRTGTFLYPFPLVLTSYDHTSPESPRWLIHVGQYEYARTSVAQTNSDGNPSDPVAVTVYKEILDTIEWEKKEGRTMSPREIIRTPAARRRLLVGASAGPFSCVAGNIIASYYLGDEMESAGISDPNDQLKAVRVFSSPFLNFDSRFPSDCLNAGGHTTR